MCTTSRSSLEACGCGCGCSVMNTQRKVRRIKTMTKPYSPYSSAGTYSIDFFSNLHVIHLPPQNSIKLKNSCGVKPQPKPEIPTDPYDSDCQG